jgi:Protein of unknown function DUF45
MATTLRSTSFAPVQGRAVPGGERIFQRIYKRLGCQGQPPRFRVEYHPYAGLSHTVRLRQDTAHVRLSDLLKEAPRDVVEAVAAILLGRLYRRRPPYDLVARYRAFSHSMPVRKRLASLRQGRARKMEHRPAGLHHDLEPMFDRLNQRYFGENLARPRLGWSVRRWRSQLGCFDPALNQIVMNRELDQKNVPEYVVSYVLYHEMLHVKHPVRFARCRRESHSAAFRKEEKLFEDYQRAVKFLARFPANAPPR